MNTVDSPKASEYERPPVMEHFKQSRSTRKLNTQPSVPMLGVGGKQLSQDTVQWDPTPEPSTNYVNSDQPPQAQTNETDQSNSTTVSKLASLLCCRRQ
ncbi:hypothetical protein F442_14562 [Phytophthora nicotianae P10297]|uniref:Uncharacterized protein n=6 Tax=Phytophthora nicotianae TaxID=4792 RepID=W2PMN6_PHYN3|nr:hypothetical protein PPTG_17241 [Phytophthora nicotianae INRA-310]ETI35111.1 hypothetical protein F443_18490 [Phytophthora nicotianae P1569]ETL28810.1 hypothetical protein L916_17895 [Phytophthora nicotianae]ETO63876.1 hypothetical protein F444_18489 [Phytophthora nicotianae P1976]ETP37638.1 hypothetical protein F442_14562 [Phytophthora nicotianae P10297]ETL82049.1 hypothetical protein L917_17716 [Phytophthora nicotianae]